MTRKTLSVLNEGFASFGSRGDFETVTEYRVGKWGVRWARDGRASGGVGGDKLHLSIVTAITAINPDYDWRPYCAESAYVSRHGPREQAEKARARQIEEHGKPWHSCRQPKVGDVLGVRPVCRFENVVGTGAWTPEQADTDRINCVNCRRHFFGEEVDAVRETQEVKAAKAERKAAKPLPARCFWCGEIRPQTKATLAGEKLPCSYCKEAMETIWWVETTGAYCKYHAEIFAENPSEKQHLLDLGVEEENKAYDRLERREGKYL